jgi:RNA polymerase sigma-70 factor (ECF subfamily)
MSNEGDESFFAAVEPLRGGLRLHCYRMLGSSHDGDDIVQETLLRAWRAKSTLEDASMLRPWLYRIATNACLDELKKRPKRAYPSDVHPPADPRLPPAPAIDEPVWLEPMPDAWLGSAPDPDPSAKYTLKESVALAFVAALSILTPVQRATLLLRDVVGLSAAETAAALGLGLGAANSALFRARQTVEDKLGGRRDAAPELPSAEIDTALLERYVRAFESGDVDELVTLLHADVVTTMPPSPTWIEGREATLIFFATMFESRCSKVRLVPMGANGQLAGALYRPSGPGERPTLHAIQVLTTRDRSIVAIDHFMTTEVFPLFRLPNEPAR